MGVERLGRYLVLKHLASGGMADVLLARTDGIEGFERHVVLKRIRSEHSKDERFIQMFLDEARVAASLHHANIVQVHDIGEARGDYFFTMEYIHGEDLRKILGVTSKNKTHMPIGYVCAIVSAAAAGLHYAHERRGSDKKSLDIVHRDVSPSNIIVSYDGSVKLVDFGIAKAAMRQVETRSGSLKGKVSYMSPEQCKGDPVDRRSDVYALGVLLYELATTTRLFKGDNDYLLMDAIVNGKVPLPRVRRPDLPNELSSIIMRALSVDPERRFQSADELRVALDQFAVKAGLTASQSALAGYMKKLFGERPEPWLDGSTPVPREDDLAIAQEPAPEPEKTRSGSNKRRATAPVSTIPPRTTRTSMNMGWEQHPTPEPDPVPGPPARGRGKLVALAAVPALAAAAFGVWQFALKPARETRHAPVVAAVAPPARAPEPTVVPIETPPPAAPTPAPAAAATTAPEPKTAPEAIAAPVPTPAPEPAPSRSRSKRLAKIASAAKAAQVVATPAAAPAAPAPAAAPTPPPAPQVAAAAPAPAAALAPAAAAPAAPAAPKIAAVAPAPATPPAPVEAVIAQLSQATVQMVASDHASQLGKCESAAGNFHGEVTVTFQIDGSGKVVKSQLATSVKNPRLVGCILKAVVSWKFPKPPTGRAKGVYSIDYQ